MKIKNTSFKTACVIAVTSLMLLSASKSFAQYEFGRRSRTYLGFQMACATRQFSVASDIAEINNLNVSQMGFDGGIVAGTDAIMGRVNLGSYKSSGLPQQKIKMTELNLGSNIFFLKLLDKKPSLLRPYIVAGFTFSNARFYGTYIMPSPMPPSHSGMMCPDEEGDISEEPIAPSDPTTSSERSIALDLILVLVCMYMCPCTSASLIFSRKFLTGPCSRIARSSMNFVIQTCRINYTLTPELSTV